jgi:hypothetical protein
MELYLPKDQFDQYCPPRLFLCTTGGKRIQEMDYYDGQLNAKWNSYSELNFSIDRTYIDMLTGETKVHPAFNKAESLRQVLVEGIGYFILQDNDATYSDKDSKSLSAFSLEYACGTKYIEHFLVNKGTEDSKEVIYLSTIYGDGYTIDKNNLYKLASGEFDVYGNYYMRTIEDVNKYEQVQVQEDEYNGYISKNNNPEAQPYEKLYVQSYPNVQFYNKNKPELSLLNLIFNYIPEWQIGNVDVNLWRKERSFEQDRIDVYSFLTNDIADTFKCVVAFDTLNKTVNFYEEVDDGITEDGKVLTRWDTDIYISRDNLANEVQIKISGDNIKTKLKVSGGDSIDVSEVNLGKSYIMNLDYYHNEDWMDQDLIEAYDDYLEAQKQYAEPYEESVQGWLRAQNKHEKLMHNIEVTTSVLLVDDVFKKLFCLYEPYDTAYLESEITDDDIGTTVTDLYSANKFSNAYLIDKTKLNDAETFVVQGYRFTYDAQNTNFKNQGSMLSYNKAALLKKLKLYHVNEDTEANVSDNVLLTLRHSDGHTATVRIYNIYEVAESYNDTYYYYVKNDNDTYQEVTIGDSTVFEQYDELYTNNYQIQCIIINASYGAQAPQQYDLSRWIRGELTDEVLNLKDYTVTSIGTMGAYLVLAKDESDPEVIENYGVNQLQEKYDAYLEVFLTQTQEMLSHENNMCIASDDEPTGNYLVGARWLDTNSRPAVLKEYDGTTWQDITDTDYEQKKSDAENYARYIDNYEKMIATQEMLVHKKTEAEYWLNGYGVSDVKNVLDTSDGSSIQENMHRVALQHFSGETVVASSMDAILPLYTFTTSHDPIAYTPNLYAYNSNTQYYVQSSIGYVQNTLEYDEETTYYIKNDETNEYVDIDSVNEDNFDEYDVLYIKNLILGSYSPIDINTITEFNEYDGSSDDKTLYIQTGHEYAVYLRGNIPYVAYKDSQGVWQAKREYISRQADIETYLDRDQMIRISPLIREDVYEDSNFFFTGHESKEEEVKTLKELMENAIKELKTLSQPSLEFSMTMANIFALPEFEPIVSRFALGNFIHIELLPGIVKRSRLLECSIGLNDFSNFSCTFGNLVTTKSEIDLHAELLRQAVTAGKQVAASKGSWQAAVDKTNELEQTISNGLRDVALRVSEGSGQAISWDSTGMHFRKYKPGSTTEYEPEEMAIINNALVATNDSWRTSKAAFGKYVIDGVERWGPIAEYVTADTIEGKYIKGGSIQIGDPNVDGGNLFTVDETGNVSIMSNGVEKYAAKSAMDIIDDAYRYRVELTYNNSTVFANTNDNCIITCTIYDNRNQKDVTTDFITKGAKFSWIRTSSKDDTTWNTNHANQTTNTITITRNDIEKNAQFSCKITIDETKMPSDEES